MLRDISLHIMDLCENSITAGATRVCIKISADTEKDSLTVTINDNGKGMDNDFLKKVQDPFTTSRNTRKVGLGIPFFKLACEMTGGSIELESQPFIKTVISGHFVLSSIDRLPLGNIGETIAALILRKPENEYILELSLNNRNKSEFSTADIKKELGDVSINNYEVLEWIKNYINEEIISVFEGIIY